MTSIAVVGVNLARAIRTALGDAAEMSDFVIERDPVSPSSGSGLRLELTDVQVESSIHADPEASEPLDVGDLFATLRILLTMNLDGAVGSDRGWSGLDPEVGQTLQIDVPLRWSGTIIDPADVPVWPDYGLDIGPNPSLNPPPAFDNRRSQGRHRVAWAPYPAAAINEALWALLEVPRRMPKSVPVVTWPDEYRTLASEIIVTRGQQAAGVLSMRLFPTPQEIARGSGPGATERLKPLIAEIVNGLMCGPIIGAMAFGPGGARAVSARFYGNWLYVVAFPWDGRGTDQERARAGREALESRFVVEENSEPVLGDLATVTFYLSTELAEESLRFVVGNDEARRAATAGVLDEDLVSPDPSLFPYSPPWFDWLARDKQRLVSEPLQGRGLYLGGIGAAYDGIDARSDEDRAAIRLRFLDTLRWPMWPLVGKVPRTEGFLLFELDEPSVRFTDSAEMLSAQTGILVDPAVAELLGVQLVGEEPGSPFFIHQDLVARLRFTFQLDPDLVDGNIEVYARPGIGPFVTPSVALWTDSDHDLTTLGRTLAPVVGVLLFFGDVVGLVGRAVDGLVSGVWNGLSGTYAAAVVGASRGLNGLPSDWNLGQGTRGLDRDEYGERFANSGHGFAKTFWSVFGLGSDLASLPDYLSGQWLVRRLDAEFAQAVDQPIAAGAAEGQASLADALSGVGLTTAVGGPSLDHPNLLRLALETCRLGDMSVRGTPAPTLVRARFDHVAGIQLDVAFDGGSAAVESIDTGVDDRAYGDGLLAPIVVALGAPDQSLSVTIQPVNRWGNGGWLGCSIEATMDGRPVLDARWFIVSSEVDRTSAEFLVTDAPTLARMERENQLIPVREVRFGPDSEYSAPLNWCLHLEGLDRWILGASSSAQRPTDSIDALARGLFGLKPEVFRDAIAYARTETRWRDELRQKTLEELSEDPDPLVRELGNDLTIGLRWFSERLPADLRAFLDPGVQFWLTAGVVADGRLRRELERVFRQTFDWTSVDDEWAIRLRLKVAGFLRDDAVGRLSRVSRRIWEPLYQEWKLTELDPIVERFRIEQPNFAQLARPEHAVRALAKATRLWVNGRWEELALVRLIGLVAFSDDEARESEADADDDRPLGRFVYWTHRSWVVEFRVGFRNQMDFGNQLYWRIFPPGPVEVGRELAADWFANSVDLAYSGVPLGETGWVREIVSSRATAHVTLPDLLISWQPADVGALQLIIVVYANHRNNLTELGRWPLLIRFREIQWQPDPRFEDLPEEQAGARERRAFNEYSAQVTSNVQGAEFSRPDVDDLLGNSGPAGGVPGGAWDVFDMSTRLKGALTRYLPRTKIPPSPPPPPHWFR